MRYLSVCSGIEAATVAWHPLGWTAAAFSEIEAFPRAALRHHWPDVPLHGRDRRKGETFEEHAAVAGFQTIKEDDYGPIDLLVGGTPCQSFSVAGKRGGMADGRGNLALEYIRLARRKRARWVAWENVPGVFSSNGGDDFRCFLSGLVGWHVPIPEGGWQNSGIIASGSGNGAYGVAWRVLDAQFFGVPQRRRRVFVVGYIGDWRRAAAVLFECHSLSGHPAPRREKGQAVAGTFKACAGSGGWSNSVDHAAAGYMIPSTGETAHCLNAGGMGRQDYETETLIAHSLRGEGQVDDCVMASSAVRRLTPEECEKLQGFPSGYTAVPHRNKPAADGPRYKVLGNSMAVPVMRWIGERIQLVENLTSHSNSPAS